MSPAPTSEEHDSSKKSQNRATLSAVYTNSSTATPKTNNFLHPISAALPPTDSTSVSDKSAYLSELRASTKELQDEINAFLTQKMEEDKLNAGSTGGLGHGKKDGTKPVDEVEEENYGEEGVGDDSEGG